jgi:hypothetical protein
MWGAYDISRITVETGWRPRPVREALHAYMDWLAAERRAVEHRDALGVVQAPDVLTQPENGRAAIGFIRTDAFEGAGCVVQ